MKFRVDVASIALLASSAVTILALGFAIKTVWTASNAVREASDHRVELEALRGDILYSGAALTGIVRAAAATGDDAWRTAYDRDAAAASTRNAREALVALENFAFHYADLGELDRALEFVTDDYYAEQRLAYERGMRLFFEASEDELFGYPLIGDLAADACEVLRTRDGAPDAEEKANPAERLRAIAALCTCDLSGAGGATGAQLRRALAA